MIVDMSFTNALYLSPFAREILYHKDSHSLHKETYRKRLT